MSRKQTSVSATGSSNNQPSTVTVRRLEGEILARIVVDDATVDRQGLLSGTLPGEVTRLDRASRRQFVALLVIVPDLLNRVGPGFGIEWWQQQRGIADQLR